MKKIKLPQSNSSYLIVFFIIFFILILLSLFIRGVQLVRSAEFRTPGFTLLVRAKDAYIVRVDTDANTYSVLHVKNAHTNEKNTTMNSIKYGVPINAIVSYPSTWQIEDIEKQLFSFKKVLSLLVHPGSSFTHMNSYDYARIYFLSRQTVKDQRKYKEIREYTYSDDIEHQIQPELFDLFKDRTIVNDGVSVQVLNATDQPGLATEVANMLENGGYNVVSVESADPQSSRVVITGESKTSDAITQLFKFPVKKKSGVSIADITVILGNNVLK